MSHYKVEKMNYGKELVEKKVLKGYAMNPRLKERNMLIHVKEIIIVNPSLKKKVLKVQFNVAYRRLFKLIMTLLDEEDTSPSDFEIAFSEIERMKSILKDRYQKELSFEEYQEYLKKAIFLENELKHKVLVESQKEQIYFNKMIEEERGRGR